MLLNCLLLQGQILILVIISVKILKKPLSCISLSDPIWSNWKHFTTTILTYLSFVPQPTSNIIILIWSMRLSDFRIFVKILKTSKSHFAIRSSPIELEALHYHYLDLPILCTSADLEYYHSHSVNFVLIILHLSDHMIIGCRHPGCLTTECTFVFIAIFSYLLCFTFSSVLKSVLPFVLVQFWYRISSVSSSVL